MRNIIIHCHMFKNAGSTFDWSLNRSFGSGFVDHRDDAGMRSGKGYLEAYFLEHPSVNALSSHHIKMPLPECKGINLFPSFLFRNPLERVGSVYEFEKKQIADTPGAINAKKMNFSDYVRWRMEETSGATIRDFQTRCCISEITKPGLALTEDDYMEAKNIISKTRLVGLVERFDESMVCFENEMKEYFPLLNLSYIRQNVNQSSSLTIDEKIEKIFNSLDADVAKSLRENNKYDLLLYDYVKSIFDKRVENICNLEQKLSDFKIRCGELSNKKYKLF